MNGTNTFKEYIFEQEYAEFNSALDHLILEYGKTGILNEGLLDTFSDKIKTGISFIKELAEIIGVELVNLLKVFKEKVIYAFFSKIGWSLSKLVKIVKDGYNAWDDLHNVIAKYLADNKIVKFGNEHLKKLDEFLQNHPIVKKIGGVLLAGLLIYIWTSMISFTGNINFDFDQSTLFDALNGNYSLADIFASQDGMKLLMFIGTATITNLTFPWPGSTGLLFAVSIIYTVIKNKYPDIGKLLITNIRKIKRVT